MSDAYDTIIIAASRRNNVPAPLIKAVIRAESAFNAKAVREEPQIGDASVGLMQLLTRTAGLSRAQLLDPATNIEAGTKYLSRLLQDRGGDLAKTISSYNGGYRPQLGLGAPLNAAKPVTITLARDAAGKPIKTATVKPGEYGNADYVRKILTWAAEYEPQLAKLTATIPPMVPADSVFNQAKATVKGGSQYLSIAPVVAAGSAGIALLAAGAFLLSKKAGM